MKKSTSSETASANRPHQHLTRRERQIMDVLYERGEASAADVQRALPQAPSYSAVRALLQKLLEKGHADFRQDGPRYLYRPLLQKQQASRNAFQRLVDTFFGGSPADAVINLLGDAGETLNADDIERIQAELQRVKTRRHPGRRKHVRE